MLRPREWNGIKTSGKKNMRPEYPVKRQSTWTNTEGAMTHSDDADREERDVNPRPVPESDPRHIDPASDLCDAVKSGDVDLSLADDQDAKDHQAFIDVVKSGELGPVDPGVEAQVRIARTLLDDPDKIDDAGEAT